MQHNTGVNPSEPTDNEAKSDTWKFFIRDSQYPTIPDAFAPHCSYVSWISSPKGNTGRYLVRGYVQFKNRRNYYCMKHRYSKKAEWVPIDKKNTAAFNEYSTDPIPTNATRYTRGKPVSQGGSVETPIARATLNLDIPDLTEDYEDVLFLETHEPLPPSPPRGQKRFLDYGLAYDASINAELNRDYIVVNGYTGEEMYGRQSGHNWTANKKR